MIPKNRVQTAQDFINKISILKNKATIKRECKAHIAQLQSEININTLRNYLTHYRTLTNDAFILSVLKISDKQNNVIEAKYKAKIVKQTASLVRIKDVQKMLETAAKVMQDKHNVFEVASALCLLTGRRMVEILKTAKFTGSKINTLTFKGQAKKSAGGEAYDIPTLTSAQECKEALKFIREKINAKDLENNEINRKYENSLNGYSYRLFSAFLGRCSTHDLRKAYASICLDKFKPKNQSDNNYLSNILGHEAQDINTANSYIYYYV